MVIGIKGEAENEKEVIVGGVNNGGQDKEGEEKKEDGVIRSGPLGRHLRTKAEAYEYLADLSDYPNLANWLAREEEASRLRRNGKKKRKGLESQVVGDAEARRVLGRDEVMAAQIGAAEGAQGNNHLQRDATLESEDAEVQQQKVSEAAQGNNHLQADAVLDSENADVKQHNGDDAGGGDNGNTSCFQERTEPTDNGNVQEESASIIHLCFSCTEEVEVTADATPEEANMNAVEDEFIDLGKKGEQVENGAHFEGTISMAADRKDIIPVKLLDLQVEKDADEKTLPLETRPMDRKDIILLKLIRPPRYFEPQDSSEQSSSESGEDDYDCPIRKKKQKRKVCSICGYHGHYWTTCKKVNECLFCGKKGHLAKNCPREDIVREQTSNFCLRCGSSGHDIFSCTNDYPADDLEKIQCFVCKDFGHLCCANYGNEGPKSLSCYNCGESGHLGYDCNKVQEQGNRLKSRKYRKKHKKLRQSNGPISALEHPNSAEKGHPAHECHEKDKEVSGPIAATIPSVPKLAETPQPKSYLPRAETPYRFGNGHQNYAPWLNQPCRFGYGHQNYVPRFDPSQCYGYGPQNYIPRSNPPHRAGYGTQNYVPRFGSPPHGWSQGRGSDYHQQQRPFFGAHRSKTWQSPTAAAEGNKIGSSSQSSNQPPND